MVKEKPGSTRIYDEDGFRRRAACICVRNDSENEVRYILVLVFAFEDTRPNNLNEYNII